MKQNLTELVVVLDRSGSMSSCRLDMEGGLRALTADQQQLPGECHLTLVQFDDIYELVFSSKPIQEVSEIRLEPRGMTALLDAVGRTIDSVGSRLSNTPEDQRPQLVIFIIITDGQENASTRYNRAQVAQMISHQRDVYSWQFTYLGANVDAFAEAGGLGIAKQQAAVYTAATVKPSIDILSANIGATRATGDPVHMAYSALQRITMNPKDPGTEDKGQA